jgi:alpha-tubulin suppressor-like RCC1 family protein
MKYVLRPAGRRAWRWAASAAAAATVAGTALAASQPAAQASVTFTQQITAGGSQACVLVRGHAHCWGADSYGQLGDGTTTDSAVPVAVQAGKKRFTQISAGTWQTCGIDPGGHAWCWGRNNFGQLGDGTTTNSDVPVGVRGNHTFTQIAAGGSHTCAIDVNGHAWCWGWNSNDQLGDGTTADRLMPVAVDTSGVLFGKTLTKISASPGTTCALDTAGHGYCWGAGDEGELGNGALPNHSLPVEVDDTGVLAGKKLAQISGTCALDASGAAYCWGPGENGELGDGTDAANRSPAWSTIPVAVSGGHSFTQISKLGDLVCGIDHAGKAWCWGSNFRGKLGIGTPSDDSTVPAAVDTSGVLAGMNLTAAAAGDPFGCALASTGAAYCWGGEDHGQLGNGVLSASEVDSPVAVTGLGG